MHGLQGSRLAGRRTQPVPFYVAATGMLIMLCLSRKHGESLMLENVNTGETITVQVVRHSDHACRIGIEAAMHWNIRRNELPPLPIQASNDDLNDLGLK